MPVATMTKRCKGMTLLEVLVALMVFGTGVLVIMLMMSRNIAWMQDIKLKTTATTLAKEWLELVYYMRDSNMKQAMYRDCVLKDQQTSTCTRRLLEPGQQLVNYVVSNDLEWTFSITPLVNPEDGRLFLKNIWQWSVWYTRGDWEKTPYTRVLTVSPAPGYEQHTNEVLAIRSTVTYEKWSTKGEVSLESFIGWLK